jgi:twitching motility protein PilT
MRQATEAENLAKLNIAFTQGNTAEIRQVLEHCHHHDSEQFLLMLLYKGLAYPDTEVQKAAAEVLGKHIKRLEEPLLTLINHPEESIRFWSLYLLGKTTRLDAKALEEILNRPEKDETKIQAAEILLRQNKPENLELLICQLGNPSWALRRFLSRHLMEKGEETVPAIRNVFVKGNLHQKFAALKFLVEISGPKAPKVIRKFLTSPDPTVKLYATAALEFIPGSKSLGHLFATLVDHSPIMRYQAAHVLSRKGNDAFREAMDILNSKGPLVREELMEIIGKILGPKSAEFFQDMVSSAVPDDRFYAYLAISQNPDLMGIRLLIRGFRDPVWVIRSLIADQLSRLGPTATEELIAALNDADFDSTSWITKTLGMTRDAMVARPLLNYVDRHPDPNVRICSVKALCQLDLEYVAELLVLDFKDSAISVRVAISEGLLAMSRLKVLKTLLIHLFDYDQTISFWSEKTLKQMQYSALTSVLEMLVTLDSANRDRFIHYVHVLKPDQLDEILRREKVQLNDFNPDVMKEEEFRLVALSDYRTLEDLLAQLKDQKGSDLHINVGLPPMFRIHGELTRASLPPVNEEKASRLLQSILNEEQRRKFEQHWEIDFSYEVKHVGRFRGNIFRQRQGTSGVFRLIPTQIPTFEELGLNRKVFEQLAENRSGLILVTGTTGSGKSTTMAAMVDHINRTRFEHILTIEDPIEFVHPHKRCSINQRELGIHTHTFSDALRSSLRENPDVILVGEMRDQETIKLALTAAETGHLVFSTLHTINTSESINRVIGAFPADHQDQVRLELGGVLRAIVSQKLMPRSDRQGRVLAHELLICTTAVKNLIKEAKTEQIISVLQSSSAENMQTMDMALAKLVIAGICNLDIVMPHVFDKKSFPQLLQPQGGSSSPAKPAVSQPLRPTPAPAPGLKK